MMGLRSLRIDRTRSAFIRGNSRSFSLNERRVIRNPPGSVSIRGPISPSSSPGFGPPRAGKSSLSLLTGLSEKKLKNLHESRRGCPTPWFRITEIESNPLLIPAPAGQDVDPQTNQWKRPRHFPSTRIRIRSSRRSLRLLVRHARASYLPVTPFTVARVETWRGK
jgi:hypothetical protein